MVQDVGIERNARVIDRGSAFELSRNSIVRRSGVEPYQLLSAPLFHILDRT